MAKKLKILIIALLGAIATICVCVVAGCKINYTVDEYREKFDLPAHVTYFLNGVGGTFNGNDKYVKEMYFPEDSTAFDIGTNTLLSGSTEMEGQEGYKFSGWYKCATDGAGNLLYKDGSVYSPDSGYDLKKGGMQRAEEYDFSQKLKDGDHIYLCGEWYEDARVHFKLISAEDNPITTESIKYVKDGNEQTVKIGDTLVGYSQIIDSALGLDNPSSMLKIPGYTLMGFYTDKEGKNEFNEWKIELGKDYGENSVPDSNDVILYAKYMQGEWTLVSEVSQIRTMFSNGSGNYYLMQSIDCSSTSTIKNASSFTGVIQGNGYTISNINISQPRVGNSKVSLFGDIGSTAKIDNVKFVNVNLDVTVNSNAFAEVYYLANSVHQDAQITNVSVQGSLNITLNSSTSVITAKESKWLYGDVDNSVRDSIKVNAICTVTLSGEQIQRYEYNNTNINSEEL